MLDEQMSATYIGDDGECGAHVRQPPIEEREGRSRVTGALDDLRP